jgi:hypothetical protein
MNQVHLLEQNSYSGSLPSSELALAKEKQVRLGKEYTKLSERLKLAQSLIGVCKDVRKVISQDLDLHLEAIRTGDRDPDKLSRNSEQIMIKLSPLIRRAVGLTQEANKIIQEEEVRKAEEGKSSLTEKENSVEVKAADPIVEEEEEEEEIIEETEAETARDEL